MDISVFDYELPDSLIAQYPRHIRGGSRFLVADKTNRTILDERFDNIAELLPEDSFLVVNNTMVLPARLPAQKITGGKTEIFFLNNLDDYSFYGMVKGKQKKDTKIAIGNEYVILKEQLEDGTWLIQSPVPVRSMLNEYGKIPLPPYIQRNPEAGDSDRYQTVYARHEGSVAAPTAGLHFTPEIMIKLMDKKIPVVELTLHVGIGTFRPIKVNNIDEHEMHHEQYTVSEESADKINGFIKEKRRLIAVGTTSVRTLESAARDDGYLNAGTGLTNLFIKPGYKFKAVKSMITNFHQPKSSLVVMVSTLMGIDFMKECYSHAIDSKYMFFSYGDSMFIK